MLIINADDFGRSVGETNAALECYIAGRITSVSAMVFMADSERAAELALSRRSDAFWGDPVCRGRVELRQSTDTLENSRALQSDELACADGTS